MPRFNADPTTLFEDGVVPDGWMTTEPSEATAAAPTGAAKGVVVIDASSMLENGSPTGVATTVAAGSGAGLTVDLVIAEGQVQQAQVNDGGDDYTQGDRVSVTGYEGVVLGVTAISD